MLWCWRRRLCRCFCLLTLCLCRAAVDLQTVVSSEQATRISVFKETFRQTLQQLLSSMAQQLSMTNPQLAELASGWEVPAEQVLNGTIWQEVSGAASGLLG